MSSQAGTRAELEAYLQHRIDNYVGSIHSKNQVNAEMDIQDGEDPTESSMRGPAGRRT